MPDKELIARPDKSRDELRRAATPLTRAPQAAIRIHSQTERAAYPLGAGNRSTMQLTDLTTDTMLFFAWQNLITRPTRTLLAVIGLTIPIVAILGLFSLTHGIRTLMGNTLARMNGLMVMRANSPAPVFSDLPASMVDELRKIPGSRIVAPEVWKICPPIEGRNLLAQAAAQMLTKKGTDKLSWLRRDDPDRRAAASRAPASEKRRLRAGTASS